MKRTFVLRWYGYVIAAVMAVALSLGSFQTQDVLAGEGDYCPPQDFSLPWRDGEAWKFTGAPHSTLEDNQEWSGLDFSTISGSSNLVRAVAAGKVYRNATLSRFSSYGWIYIDHDDNDWFSHYVHLDLSSSSQAQIPPDGTHVNVGDVVGVMGATGGDAVHLHIGFSCGNTSDEDQVFRLSDSPITLEGWKPFSYLAGDGVVYPEGHGPPTREYDVEYYGYLQKGNTIKHACKNAACSPYPASNAQVTAHHCGVAEPGANSSNYDKFNDLFYAQGGDSVLGCSTNPTHWYPDNNGNPTGDYSLVVQDFYNAGTDTWSTIIHDEFDDAENAFVIRGPIQDKYLNNTDGGGPQMLGAPITAASGDNTLQAFEHGSIYITGNGAFNVYDPERGVYDSLSGSGGVLGYPANERSNAATSPHGTTGTWQQFENGQIYSSSFGTFATYGTVYGFYYNYEEGGTHSSLGFPVNEMGSNWDANGTTAYFQEFEGGTVFCPVNGSCSVVQGDFCPGGGGGGGADLNVVNAQSVPANDSCGGSSDTEAPTQGTVDLPSRVKNSLKPRVEVIDSGSGVAWVQVHIRVPGGGFGAHPMTYANGMWEIDLDTSGYADEQVLEYLFWAGDGAGNAAQISGLNTVMVDRAIPAVSDVQIPNPVYNTMDVSIQINDPAGVTSASVHVKPTGGSFTAYPLSQNGDRWEGSIDVSGYVHGTELQMVFHATDGVGNQGQISGSYYSTREVPTPTINIDEPNESGLVYDQFGIKVDIDSSVDIKTVKVFVYYYTKVDESARHQEVFTISQPMWGNRKQGSWKVDVDLYGGGIPTAIAQNDAWLQAVAYDYNGNETIQNGIRQFDIYLKDIPVFVDAKEEWRNYMPDPDGSDAGLTIFDDSVVQIKYVDGFAYSAYPEQPQVPGGDGGVCLNSDCLAEQGAKALMVRYSKIGGSRVIYYVGDNGYHAWARYTGWIQFAFNDDNSFGNNGGGWNLKVSVWPPSYKGEVDTVTVKIREDPRCNSAGCPQIELWVMDSDGHYRKTGQWETNASEWTTRNRTEFAYLWTDWQEALIVYTNDSGDRDYQIDWIEVNGVRVQAEASDSRYCVGTNYDPFNQVDCRAGQQNMVWNGALRFKNPNASSSSVSTNVSDTWQSYLPFIAQ